MLTILGLGPGSPNLLTREAWEVISNTSVILMRTSKHPTVRGFPTSVKIRSFDHLYQKHAAFDDVYETIVEAVLRAAHKADVVYAVPGHPLFGERTTPLLLARARKLGIATRIVGGVSFVEPTLEALAINEQQTQGEAVSVVLDPIKGLQLCDALDLAAAHHPALNPDRPALVAQIYSRAVASDVKLTLMNEYPPGHLIAIVHGAPQGGRSTSASDTVTWSKLAELDHQDSFDHLTSLYIPALARVSGIQGLQETTAHLRAPGGCPWDREQTHASLRSDLLEETYEVLHAIEQDDLSALQEELGDLLFNIVLQVQIATEAEHFRMTDVIGGIDAKLKRRHPHVFGDVQVADAAQVFINWEAIKKKERKARGDGQKSALDGIAPALPALARAQKMGARAERTGFRWESPAQRLGKVREELREVLTAKNEQHRFEEFGDLLFTISVLANGYKIDAESALREACAKFARRFHIVEQLTDGRGLDMRTMNLRALLKIWGEAKKTTDAR